MTDMKVTIAIPTYRRPSYLKQAIASAQQQTHKALQIVVSDNASGDGTGAYLDTLSTDSRVLVLRQSENLGMVGNWNACLRRAEGDWFLLLSDDDYLEPEAVARMLVAGTQSAAHESVGMLYCRSRTVDAHGQQLSVGPLVAATESARSFAMAYFERERVLFPCSLMLRTDDLRALGGYRAEGVKLGCDAIAWSEAILRRGAVACAPDALSNYRVHPNNLTSTEAIECWAHDLRVLIDIWDAAFQREEAATKVRYQRASSRYYNYFLATVLSQGAVSTQGTVRAIRRFARHRAMFQGMNGRSSMLFGIARALLPTGWERAARSTQNRFRSYTEAKT